MPYTWEFIEESNNAQRTWRWKKHALDGTTHETGSAFLDYSETTKDAVTHGFRPSRQPWVVITPTTVTHFTKDQLPITEPRSKYQERREPPDRSTTRKTP